MKSQRDEMSAEIVIVRGALEELNHKHQERNSARCYQQLGFCLNHEKNNNRCFFLYASSRGEIST